jgi:hypothetical protein
MQQHRQQHRCLEGSSGPKTVSSATGLNSICIVPSSFTVAALAVLPSAMKGMQWGVASDSELGLP